jgi:hypothetical protein
MEKIPMMVALKIHQYYPDRVAVIPIHDEDKDVYSCALYKIGRNGNCYEETLYELGHYKNTEEIKAVEEMVKRVTEAMKTVTIMCN